MNVIMLLSNVMSSAEYALPEALVLCNGKVSVDGKVVYIPIYMLMFWIRSKQ